MKQLSPVLALLLTACVIGDEDPETETETDLSTVDEDGDGFSPADGDCNDNQSSYFPGAADTAGDGADQNCDGTDGVDADGDGVASEASGGTDCEDGDAATYPGAAPGDSETGCMTDADGDDYGASTVSGTAEAGSDCDDHSSSVNPSASEVAYDGIDQDCSGGDLCDVDGDGSDYDGAECFGQDCDDGDEAVSPLLTEAEDWELCGDGLDNDCDGKTDGEEGECHVTLYFEASLTVGGEYEGPDGDIEGSGFTEETSGSTRSATFDFHDTGVNTTSNLGSCAWEFTLDGTRDGDDVTVQLNFQSSCTDASVVCEEKFYLSDNARERIFCEDSATSEGLDSGSEVDMEMWVRWD